MAPTFKSQIRYDVRLFRDTGLPADAVMNTWSSFAARAMTDSEIMEGMVGIRNFYAVNTGDEGPYHQTHELRHYLSPTLLQDDTVDAISVTAYDIDRGHGAGPLMMYTDTLGVPEQHGLPDQTALCVSWHADETGIPEVVGSTRPQERRRGRIFLGPLNYNAITGDIGEPHPEPLFIADIKAALTFLWDVFPVGSFGVWSRRDVDADHPYGTVRIATAAFVDNRFDTQRRRAELPSSRTAWTF